MVFCSVKHEIMEVSVSVSSDLAAIHTSSAIRVTEKERELSEEKEGKAVKEGKRFKG